MAVNTVHLDKPPDAVFAVLADGWTYSNWVVGTSHMRAVERAWPQVGSKVYHAAGAWPLVRRDETVVEAVEPGRRLVLTARGRPLGQARIVLELGAESGGCRLTMSETPIAGAGRLLRNPLADAMLHRRNTEALNRLKAVVERATDPSSAGSDT